MLGEFLSRQAILHCVRDALSVFASCDFWRQKFVREKRECSPSLVGAVECDALMRETSERTNENRDR